MSGSHLRFDLEGVGSRFQIPGQFRDAMPYGNGHINDTFLALYEHEGSVNRYVQQRINHRIFQDPIALMENVARVTSHQHRKLRELGDDSSRRALTLVPSEDGLPYVQDSEGNTWRTYLFIERARCYEAVETPAQAAEAAKAFGYFQRQLADLPGPRLHETIADFHHTPKRLERLVAAMEKDVCNRLQSVREEVAFVLSREAMTRRLLEQKEAGLIPERITHNDTKLNNIMLDDNTMEGICVIDLDTVMPGLALYDFGDMVRTATSPAREDTQDLAQVRMQMPMFEALLDGYLRSVHSILTPTEKAHLVFSGKLITLEIGMRFLTDYLEGDQYFRIKHPSQNLDRSRTQFRLVSSIESQEEAMQQRVEAWTPPPASSSDPRNS